MTFKDCPKEIKNGDLRPTARIAREQESFSRRVTRSTARHAILPSFPFLKHLTMKKDWFMPKRIFIVDDNLGVRRSLRSFFDSQTGFEVCGEAADGFYAIEKAKEANPDLVVLDFSMPELNGRDTAAILSPLMPEVPIILFTAFDTAVRHSDAYAYGISAVVSKTESLNALAEQVQALLTTV